MKSRFAVFGTLDHYAQYGTVTIDRNSGTFAVRPKRRRREYVLPLSTVAEIVCARIIKAEVAAARAAKKKGKK
jgi:hypothetical protein